ncbi:MAG: PAS domain S-box protein, partial [Candidatus Promineifilaceae bacterium]
MKVVRILVIEDNEDDFVLLDAFLDPSEFQLTWSNSAGQARQQLAKSQFDLILLDHGLPDTNALTFVRELTDQHEMPPVIVLTGMEDQTLAVSAIKQGAANYILKDEIAFHLLPAISEALDHSVLVSSRDYYQQADRFVDSADNIYETLLDTMTEGCLVVARFGQITFVNSAIGQLLSRPPEALLGRNVTTLFAPHSREELQTLLASQQGSKSTQTGVMEGALLCSEKNLPVQVSARSLQGSDTKLLVLTDISAQVESRSNLARLYQQASEEQSRLQAIIESSWDGLMFMTVQGEILSINRKLIELLGLHQERQWVGSDFAVLFTALGESWQPLADEIKRMLRSVCSGVADEGEHNINGKMIEWQMNSVLDGRNPIGLLVVLRDVTDVRSAENMREDLTRALVHDLRNPLTSILSSLELIQRFGLVGRNTLSDKQAHYVKGAMNSTIRVSNLVSSILDMEELESGEMPLNKQMIALASIADEVVAAQTAVAVAKKIQIRQHVSASLPMLPIDHSLIRRVLQNLVDNAIKFTPYDGRVMLSAEATLHT